MEIQKTNASLSVAEDVFRVGQELKRFIQKNGLSSKINDKQYAHVDAWKFAGSCFGLTAIPKKPERLHSGEVMVIGIAPVKKSKYGGGQYIKDEVVYYGFKEDLEGFKICQSSHDISKTVVKPYFAYECECEVKSMTSGEVVSYGTGFCSNLEATKCLFDEYSVNSTSQTRAIGKAYRNLIGFIMNEAGYENTPAEEMEEDHIKEAVKSSSKPTKPRMNKSQVGKTMIKIINGDIDSIKKIEAAFDLDDDQRNVFEMLFKERNTV